MTSDSEIFNILLERPSRSDLNGLIQSWAAATIDFSHRVNNSIFIEDLCVTLCKSVLLVFDKLGDIKYFEFYGIRAESPILDFIADQMNYKSTIDQTSRDNIYLSIYAPKHHRGIKYIEVISREPSVKKGLPPDSVDAIRLYLDVC